MYFNSLLLERVLQTLNTHLKVHFSHGHLVEIAYPQHRLGCVQEDWETWPPPGGILLGCQFAPYTVTLNANPFLLDKSLEIEEQVEF